MSLSQEQVVGLYRQMVTIRKVDEELTSLKLKDLVMNGFHPYEGQEAVAAGVCLSLRKDDYVTSTHRPQGHAIAKGASVRSIFCEMLGRVGGPSDGIGGPMQWIDADNRFFCGSIVGSGICYVTGFGMALKREGKGNIAVCFFGDGASNTGSFHEGLNLASLWRLPILFVCENNQYGEAMPVRDFVPIRQISDRAGSYGIEGRTVDGMDVACMADAAVRAVDRIRSGKGPVLLEAMTYRYKGHFIGDPLNYRTDDEVQQWRKRDPIAQCGRVLSTSYGVAEGQLAIWDREIADSICRDRDLALSQPIPTVESAISNVLIQVAGRMA